MVYLVGAAAYLDCTTAYLVYELKIRLNSASVEVEAELGKIPLVASLTCCLIRKVIFQ